MNLQIRKATSEDHSFLHELNRLVNKDLVVRQFGSWVDSYQRARFDAKLKKATFRIVELNNRAIAAIWSTEQADHVLLHELLVHPEFQNKGVGSQLLSLEIDQVKSSKKPIRLHTLVLNHAQEFYKQHGFKEVGRDDVYVEMEKEG